MVAPAIFAPAYTYIDGQLDEFLNTRLSSVMGQVSGPLRLALVLYVILYGIAILRGSISEPLTDFAVRSVRLHSRLYHSRFSALLSHLLASFPIHHGKSLHR